MRTAWFACLIGSVALCLTLWYSISEPLARTVVVASLGLSSLFFALSTGRRLLHHQRQRAFLRTTGSHLAFAYLQEHPRAEQLAGDERARIPGVLWAFPNKQAREAYLAADNNSTTARKTAIAPNRLPEGWTVFDAIPHP